MDDSYSHNSIQFLGNIINIQCCLRTYYDLLPNIGVSNELGSNGDIEKVFSLVSQM